MRWEDERYVRIYTRDTTDWLCLSFIAQGLFCLLARKVDRAGLLKLGKHGKKAVAIIIGFPGDWPRLEPALEELLEDGCVQIRGEYLLIPNFIEAQEATQSDAQRKRESRARSRDLAAAADVLNTDKTSGPVTDGHETGQKVTSGHNASQVVTPNCAVPSRAEPISLTHRASVREQGERDRLAILAPRPLTASLLAELEARGFDCGFPAKAATSDAIERALAAVTVPVAADRVMTRVNQDRRSDVVPHATLGWYLDAIRGQPEGGRRASKQSNPQTGVAAPADASAFGEGGQRAIE